MSNMKPDRTVLILGRRGTGKSNLLFNMLFHLRDSFDTGCAMSPTMSSRQEMKQVFPEALVFEEGYSVDQLSKLLGAMKETVEKGKERHALLCLDDCMADRALFKGEPIRDLHLNGRHYFTGFINCAQFLMDMTPDIRTQTDYVFVLRCGIHDEKAKLHKYFFGCVQKYSDFDKIFTECTQNYGAIVLDNTLASTGMSNIFYYKAVEKKMLPPFKMFRPVYWSLSDKYIRAFKAQSAAGFKSNDDHSGSKNERVDVVELEKKKKPKKRLVDTNSPLAIKW